MMKKYVNSQKAKHGVEGDLLTSLAIGEMHVKLILRFVLCQSK